MMMSTLLLGLCRVADVSRYMLAPLSGTTQTYIHINVHFDKENQHHRVALWNVTSCGQVRAYRRSGGTNSLHV